MTRRFLLATMFSAGDVVPFVRLGARLAARGHHVTLATHAPYRALAEEAGLAFATWDTADEHAAMMKDGALFDDIAGFTTMYERHIVPKLHREADALREHCDEHTMLVTRCGPAIAARAVAEQRGATLVEAYLGPGHITPLDVLREFARPFRDELRAVRGRDDAADAWITACTARVGWWPAWFAAPESHWPPGLELTGFVPGGTGAAALDPTLEAALAAPGPRVLLASGTGRFLTASVVATCARVVDQLGGTLVFVTPFDDLVPAPLPANVHRFRAAPYASLIPRMDLVIHHGGIGTMVDALRAGVPQIALGAGGDRPVNARCAQRLEVARYVPPSAWGDETIATAARELLGSEAVRQACRNTAEQLRTDDADPSRALEAVTPESFTRALERATADAPAATAATAPTLDRARLDALTPAQRALLAKRLRR